MKKTMQKRSKQIAALAAIAVLAVFALAGCGGTADQPEPEVQTSDTLVVYFSATGNTAAVATAIAEAQDADLYELIPVEPYTSADLDWREPTSRVNAEHEDPTFRPEIAGSLPDLSGYEKIFIGYPIWWGEAPPLVRSYVEQVDLSGKTVIPFCTSSSSGLGASGENLAAIAPNASWLAGQNFSGGVDEAALDEWLAGLGL